MKTRIAFLFALLFLMSGIHAQTRYFTKTGTISFYSHTPMEDINAKNHQVTSFLDIDSGEMVFAVLIRSFEFKKSLMEEHFNENYMDSEKFPKSQFKGSIVNIKDIDFFEINSASFAKMTGQDIVDLWQNTPRVALVDSAEGVKGTSQIMEWAKDLGRKRGDLFEIAVWKDGVHVVGDTLYYYQAIHQESDVIPENIDCIRAMCNVETDKYKSMEKTDKAMGLIA